MGAVITGHYEPAKAPFWIDFSIQPSSVPVISYKDVLNEEPSVLGLLKSEKVIVGGTALELGDRFNIPNGHTVSGVVLQALAAESIVQGRLLQSPSLLAKLAGPIIIILGMIIFWHRTSAMSRVVFWSQSPLQPKLGAIAIQAKLPLMADTALLHIAIAAYLTAIALDEIDLRGLLGLIAERRFQRIAMSLGDGLICADKNGLITVWNPTASAIFGFQSEEMLGCPFDMICAGSADPSAPNSFSILALPHELLQAPGGKTVELYGRRKNGELFPLEVCFSGWPGWTDLTTAQSCGTFRSASAKPRASAIWRNMTQLTGLANRHALSRTCRTHFPKPKSNAAEVALLVIGLDKFQVVIDMFGHAYGEQLICAAAERLVKVCGDAALVARLDGDEFSVVVEGKDAASAANELAERICRSFSENPLSVDTRAAINYRQRRHRRLPEGMQDGRRDAQQRASRPLPCKG